MYCSSTSVAGHLKVQLVSKQFLKTEMRFSLKGLGGMLKYIIKKKKKPDLILQAAESSKVTYDYFF